MWIPTINFEKTLSFFVSAEIILDEWKVFECWELSRDSSSAVDVKQLNNLTDYHQSEYNFSFKLEPISKLDYFKHWQLTLFLLYWCFCSGYSGALILTNVNYWKSGCLHTQKADFVKHCSKDQSFKDFAVVENYSVRCYLNYDYALRHLQQIILTPTICTQTSTTNYI